jgi:hypothetical protein
MTSDVRETNFGFSREDVSVEHLKLSYRSSRMILTMF